MAGPCSGGILYAPQHSRCRHRLSQEGVASLRFVPEMRRYDLLWRCLLVGLLAKSRIIVCVAVLRFSILNLQFVVVIHLVHFRGQHEIDLLLLPAPATSSQHTHTHTHAHTLSPSLSLSLTHTHTHTHTHTISWGIKGVIMFLISLYLKAAENKKTSKPNKQLPIFVTMLKYTTTMWENYSTLQRPKMKLCRMKETIKVIQLYYWMKQSPIFWSCMLKHTTTYYDLGN